MMRVHGISDTPPEEDKGGGKKPNTDAKNRPSKPKDQFDYLDPDWDPF